MNGETTVAPKATTGADTERKSEASGGLGLYIPVPGMPIGGIAIDDADTRAPIGPGVRVSTLSRKRRGSATSRRRVANGWIW
jgi:hypothetical protein